ncbi:MAG: metal-dependent phosphohydrolase [uncultured bacterium (gcode 4)]|uniref:Metal-dependent phosphohydrolase n=1 Tax=uncultured bacterium (gcode 4) TaxID=1234023 RepID=K2A2D5_9BACT|nr:MAG: metal-dependent phosphohydrolase [uncultured bacterium (gcode 4)]
MILWEIYHLSWKIMTEQKIINNALHYILYILDPINHYPYHNINHTLDVYARVGYLTDKEQVFGEDKTDLLIAALFHDTGFTVQYMNNEKIGAQIARTYLLGIKYKESRIQKIERLILSTVLFSETHDILEEIIQDADLDNLGRKDCFIKTLLVRKELNTIAHMNISKRKWLEVSYNLIRTYQYRTVTAKWERTELKIINTQKLEEKITHKK